MRCERLFKMRIILNLLILAILGGRVMFPAGYATTSVTAKEYQIKAVFLYNFTKGYITWPSSAFANQTEPFHLCIIGEDPFGTLLDSTIKDQKGVESRSLVIDRITRPTAISSCHILFISKQLPSNSLTEILKVAQNSHTLTVSDREGFAEQQGGMVEFFTFQDRIKLAINTCALKPAKLKASAKLLQLSKLIRKDCPPK